MAKVHAHVGFGPAELAARRSKPYDWLKDVETVGVGTLLEVIPTPPDIAYVWLCTRPPEECEFIG